MKILKIGLMFGAIMAATVALAGAVDRASSDEDDKNTQLARLHELQAAFHRAASVHDPVNGDSAAAIDQRILDMVSLWTDDGSLTLEFGGALDGNYVGKGDPSDPSTCPAPSADPGNRGTLCTFFKYVAGSFKPANKFISLTPSYAVRFDIHGNKATVNFQCHYFNVAMDPATGKPLWTPVSHVAADGSASKDDGRWLFSHLNAPVAGIPIP